MWIKRSVNVNFDYTKQIWVMLNTIFLLGPTYLKEKKKKTVIQTRLIKTETKMGLDPGLLKKQI